MNGSDENAQQRQHWTGHTHGSESHPPAYTDPSRAAPARPARPRPRGGGAQTPGEDTTREERVRPDSRGCSAQVATESTAVLFDTETALLQLTQPGGHLGGLGGSAGGAGGSVEGA
jgi:hypothetical protein